MIKIRFALLSAVFLLVVSTYAQNSVKTHEGVMIGGIKQWIGARGDDSSKPLLLFLHGGPGFSSRSYSKKFVKELKKDFIVTQWDQRETGITKHWGPYADSLTLDLFYQDTEEVVDYVIDRFNKQKIYLAGYSWGGLLGMNYANNHSEKLHAYIHVNGMISGDENVERIQKLLLDKSEDLNEVDRAELTQIQVPLTSWQDYYLQRKWTAKLLTENNNESYSKSLWTEWASKWWGLSSKAFSIDLFEEVKSIDCPIYFFVGRRDYVAYFEVIEEFYQGLDADKKELIWFEAGHELPSQDYKNFAAELVRISQELN